MKDKPPTIDNAGIIEDTPSLCLLLDDISWPEVEWEKLKITDVAFYDPKNKTDER